MAIIIGLIIFAIVFYFAFLRKQGESREKGIKKIAVTLMVLVIIIVVVLILGSKGYLG